MLDAAVQRSQTDPQAGGEIRLRAFPAFQEFAQAGILVIDALRPRVFDHQILSPDLERLAKDGGAQNQRL